MVGTWQGCQLYINSSGSSLRRKRKGIETQRERERERERDGDNDENIKLYSQITSSTS